LERRVLEDEKGVGEKDVRGGGFLKRRVLEGDGVGDKGVRGGV